MRGLSHFQSVGSNSGQLCREQPESIELSDQPGRVQYQRQQVHHQICAEDCHTSSLWPSWQEIRHSPDKNGCNMTWIQLNKKLYLVLISLLSLFWLKVSVDFWKGDKNNYNIIPICVSDGTENYVDKIAIASGYASFSWGSIEPQMITTKKHIHLNVLDDEHCTTNHDENTALSINNFIQVCAKEVKNTTVNEKCGVSYSHSNLDFFVS